MRFIRGLDFTFILVSAYYINILWPHVSAYVGILAFIASHLISLLILNIFILFSAHERGCRYCVSGHTSQSVSSLLSLAQDACLFSSASARIFEARSNIQMAHSLCLAYLDYYYHTTYYVSFSAILELLPCLSTFLWMYFIIFNKKLFSISAWMAEKNGLVKMLSFLMNNTSLSADEYSLS